MATTAPRPVREAPTLLLDIDLGREVSEDLRISTPRLPKMAVAPRAAASLSMTGPRAVISPGRSLGGRRMRRGVRASRSPHKPPAALRAMLIEKLRRVVPPDGDLVFTFSYNQDERVGDDWVNYHESPFWLSSEHQLGYAVDEWANWEYEHISESFYNEEAAIPCPGRDGYFVRPTVEDLLTAWDEVAHENMAAMLTVEVHDSAGESSNVVDHIVVSAQFLMDHYGIGSEDLFPTVVLAHVLLQPDMDAIFNDEEVFLDEGYVVTAIENEDYRVVRIEPKL